MAIAISEKPTITGREENLISREFRKRQTKDRRESKNENIGAGVNFPLMGSSETSPDTTGEFPGQEGEQGDEQEEEALPKEESRISRRLNMMKFQAKQMAQQAAEVAKQMVKKVVKRVIMQIINSIIGFIIANWWIILIAVIVIFAALYVAYIVENPTEALTSLKSVGCAIGSIFGNNYDCWADAIFK